MGVEAAADAGIYRLSDELAIVQSLDFFTPIVDDPYEFGQIAAANSLSDIYAVGATPVTAMNILCFPIKEQPKAVLKAILKGGIEKIHEAEALLVGGHSVEDPEPKYGLSVTGLVHPKKFISNSGARPGDVLVLTKPVGMGILSTALKAGMLGEEARHLLIDVMKTLNRDASRLMVELGASGATDITGFGLAGHTLEMAIASKCTIKIAARKVPVLPETMKFLKMGFIPEGDYSNKEFCQKSFEIDKGLDNDLVTVLFDAQTSGGLLISIKEPEGKNLVKRLHELGHEHASIIGNVKEGPGRVQIVQDWHQAF